MGPIGFTEPSLLELVPTLVGESNFSTWTTSLKWTLDSRDPQYYELLTGVWSEPSAVHPTQPTPTEVEARTQWDNASRYLLPLLNATVHQTVRIYILDANNARTAYANLHRAFAARSYEAGFANFLKFMNTTYTSNKPQAFVNEWRIALSDLQECNSTKLTPLLIFYHFLNAVSANPAAHLWLDNFLNSKVSTDTTIEATFADFVVFEDHRLNALNQAHSFSMSKVNHLPFFCRYHNRQAGHSSEHCFRNPINQVPLKKVTLAPAPATAQRTVPEDLLAE
ncbi:hypothetical protein Pdw03_1446 [Penicillium digitatum]|uniref:Uncharacterized protein n=3 Tax=Penicillium digitatum TaxID=36651 RepID=K9FW34_PEND2|nr:hypothetical protein PDIP_40700 [Penicillium digitatum Pd1]EKV12772.1 hypothetical protein PDIG_42080 [Penicillium digitatum PHI26]EKV15327.1 hypothetical protein PDIP_40700 [Penicillium digitatum Pd1]KAG0152880.1 hypothetical protein PDIDSM_2685 [Penicillium digitatum]QQK46548.1 hypothetical protein Pdw03_1446 [Penicillium digitatum]